MMILHVFPSSSRLGSPSSSWPCRKVSTSLSHWLVVEDEVMCDVVEVLGLSNSEEEASSPCEVSSWTNRRCSIALRRCSARDFDYCTRNIFCSDGGDVNSSCSISWKLMAVGERKPNKNMKKKGIPYCNNIGGGGAAKQLVGFRFLG